MLFRSIFSEIPEALWTRTRKRSSSKSVKIINEKYYKPSLPLPSKTSKGERDKSINFSRNPDEIKIVSEYLFEDKDCNASEVGNECFDIILKEAQT